MMQGILSQTDISASGLSAERLRMEVIGNNIANANTTRTAEGGPYRRREVVFSAAMENAMSRGEGTGMRGVEVLGVQSDNGDLPRVYQPGHPDADADGFVLMPNVSLANEMVDLITANRGYDANLKVLRSFRDMVQQTLTLLRRT
ncbi:MAG: flagellar basal body rod protein FlgC [Planctomycetales bacterium]|nr:flagellar basal body rod protein FlgC [Planctomycetales bacterium]MCA9170697.1 flagellar basal body rod protein FlgC [Planctomycetales bacterium]